MSSYLTDYSTAVNTRSLSVITKPGGSDINSSTAYLLFYENPTSEVSALSQRALSTFGPGSTEWIDITHTLHESEPNATFSAPFASRSNFSADPGLWSSVGRFYSPFNASLGTTINVAISIGPSDPKNDNGDSGMQCTSSHPK